MSIAGARKDFSQFVAEVAGFSNPHYPEWTKILDEHKRAVIWKHQMAGATTFVILRIVWELGNDPTLRIGVLANTLGQGSRILHEVAKLIDHDEKVREIFPRLKIAPRGPLESLRVEGRGSMRRHADPYVYVIWALGATTGRRFDRLFVDNMLDQDSTRDKAACARTEAWFRESVLPRLTTDAEVTVFEEKWHRNDLAHSLVRKGGHAAYAGFVFPVLRRPTSKTSGSAIPQLWPMSRILNTRREIGEKEFARAMLCKLER